MQYKDWGRYLLLTGLCLIGRVYAQSATDTLVGLDGMLDAAAQRFHTVRASKFAADAAAADVRVAKYSRMPTLDASYQAGIGTANNLTGQFYPGEVMPMTGRPSSSNNYSTATGSAASLLVNWQAVSFGQRDARIAVSVAEAETERAGAELTLFQYKIDALSAYLDLLLAYDLVAIQQHNIERGEAVLRESRYLSNTGIRPGVDTALFISELSKSRVEYLQAVRQLRVNQLTLAQLIVTDAIPVPVDTAFLKRLPVGVSMGDTAISAVPVIREGESQILLNQSKEQLLKKSFLPTINLWGTGFARGSGFEATGDIKTWDGLGLSRYNYGAGVQLVVPILKYGEVRRQMRTQSLLSSAATEQLEERKTELTARQRIAGTTFQNDIAVARETELSLHSADYAYGAMRTRYSTGLATFADLIQAQFGLLKSELDVRRAYWDAWKALLLEAAVKGDANIFLNATR